MKENVIRGFLCILGILDIIFGTISLYNWLASILPIHLSNVEAVFNIVVPGDLGYSIAIITVGSLSLASAYWGLNNVKGIAALFLSSTLAVGLLGLQLLIATANVCDTVILKWSNEAVEYNPLNDVLRIEVIVGLVFLPILKYSTKILEETGILRK